MAKEPPQGIRPFLEAQQEVRRLFQEIVHQPWGGQAWGGRGQTYAASWQPRCDMLETDEAIVVDVELPGVKRDDVRLEVERDVLHIAGERRAMAQRQARNYHYLEQQYGRFERQLRLPRTVDRAAIRAEFENGVLSITLPKKQDRALPAATDRPDADRPDTDRPDADRKDAS